MESFWISDGIEADIADKESTPAKNRLANLRTVATSPCFQPIAVVMSRTEELLIAHNSIWVNLGSRMSIHATLNNEELNLGTKHGGLHLVHPPPCSSNVDCSLAVIASTSFACGFRTTSILQDKAFTLGGNFLAMKPCW